jgi:hypothetical protein
MAEMEQMVHMVMAVAVAEGAEDRDVHSVMTVQEMEAVEEELQVKLELEEQVEQLVAVHLAYFW